MNLDVIRDAIGSMKRGGIRNYVVPGVTELADRRRDRRDAEKAAAARASELEK